MSEDNSLGGIILFFVLSLGIAGYGGYAWIEQGEALDAFEPTEAEVVSSRVSTSTEGGDGVIINYRYRVDGTSYESSNVWPGPGDPTKDHFEAEEIVENHPKGAEVTAYYDPQDPSDAFLLEDRSVMPLLILVMGGGMALLALFAVFQQ